MHILILYLQDVGFEIILSIIVPELTSAQNGFDIMGRKFTKLSNGNVQISINVFLVWANMVWN